MKRIAEIMIIMFVLAGMVFTGCKQNATAPKEKEKPLPEGVDGRLKVNDFYSLNFDEYLSLTFTEEKQSFIYEIELKNPGDAYILLNTDMNDETRQSYTKKMGTRCDSKFILTDSEGNAVTVKNQDGNQCEDGIIDDQAFSFICPEEKGTYYLEIIPYNHGDIGHVAVYLYHGNMITDFTFDVDNVTVGAGKTVNVPFTYTSETSDKPYGFYFIITSSGSYNYENDYCITSYKVNKDGTGYVTVHGLFPGDGRFYVRESVSGKLKDYEVTVNVDASSSYETIACGTDLTPSENDLTVINFAGKNQAKMFELNLTKDVSYMIETYKDSDCYYFMYNSAGELLSKTHSQNLFYTPDISGKYYFLIKHRETNLDETEKIYFCSVGSISSMQFVNSQETFTVGVSKTITVTYTGTSAVPLVFKIENEPSHVCFDNITDNGDGIISLTVIPLAPFDSEFYLIEKVSGLKANCKIKANFNSSDAIVLPSDKIGTQSSVNTEDYIRTNLSSKQAVYYKLELDANNEYHFEVFDNCAYNRIFSNIPEGFSLGDAMYSLFDANGQPVNVTSVTGTEYFQFDGGQQEYDVKFMPSASGIYYLFLRLYDPINGSEGDVYFHIYKPN